MVIPRLFIERQITHTPKGYRVTAHVRPRQSIFTKIRYHYFPTSEEAEEWMRQRWVEGWSPRMTTQSVLWVVPDLVITLPYKLPSMTTTRENGSLSGGSGSGLSVWLNGIKVATDARTGRDLKRQLLLSPLADCLHAVPCNRCGRLPHVNLHAGTLEHRHKDCGTQIKMVRDSLTPSPVQIALWNRKLYRRPGTTTLLPLSRPHFMILGVLREPTEFDRVKRIRRIEAYSLDE